MVIVDGLAGRSNSFLRVSFRLVAQALAQLEVQNAYEQTEADAIRQDDHDVAFGSPPLRAPGDHPWDQTRSRGYLRLRALRPGRRLRLGSQEFYLRSRPRQ
jgi:hypothetical protein